MWSEPWELLGGDSARGRYKSLDSAFRVRVRFFLFLFQVGGGGGVKVYDNWITVLLKSAHSWCSGGL